MFSCSTIQHCRIPFPHNRGASGTIEVSYILLIASITPGFHFRNNLVFWELHIWLKLSMLVCILCIGLVWLLWNGVVYIFSLAWRFWITEKPLGIPARWSWIIPLVFESSCCLLLLCISPTHPAVLFLYYTNRISITNHQEGEALDSLTPVSLPILHTLACCSSIIIENLVLRAVRIYKALSFGCHGT